MQRTAALGCVAALLALGATACSTSGKAEGGVVTVTVPAPVRTVHATGHTSPTPSGTPSSSPSTHPSTLTKLPGTCEDLLPHYDVVRALGGKQLAGADAFVVGVPEKDIGRIGYLNCRYGVTGKGAAAVPKVEIGVSLYSTPAQASARVVATVEDYSGHGATATDIAVGQLTGTLLTGGSGGGYDVPLLVVASGQRTVAVSIAPAVASGAKASADAVSLASLALQRSG